MQDESNAFQLALSLVAGPDADLFEIIGLSLRVSLCALVVASLIGISNTPL